MMLALGICLGVQVVALVMTIHYCGKTEEAADRTKTSAAEIEESLRRIELASRRIEAAR